MRQKKTMQAKGTAVLTIPLFIKEKHGEQAFQKWLSHLSVEAQEVFKFPVLLTNWYPVQEVLIEPVQKICELFYDGSERGAWESGRFSADYGLKGIYKVFIRVGSVQFLVNKATTILPTYYDSCSIDVVEFKAKKSVMHITEFPNANVIVEQRIGGWIERALEISGCKDVKIDITKSLTKDDLVTEYNMAWN